VFASEANRPAKLLKAGMAKVLSGVTFGPPAAGNILVASAAVFDLVFCCMCGVHESTLSFFMAYEWAIADVSARFVSWFVSHVALLGGLICGPP